MRTITIIDDRESPTKGQEIARAVTAVEVPPVFVYALTGYRSTPLGLKPVGECVTLNEAPKELKKFVRLAKKSVSKPEDLAGCTEYRVKVYTQPFKTGTGKKTPELVELGLGGTPEEQFEYAKTILGKEIAFGEALTVGETVDAVGVTKGKGWQGVVKRFGVALQFHKATQKRRHGGTIGPERQAKVMYTVPRAGQMGFHRRTDKNKRILSTGSKLDYAFHCYGPIKGDYLLLDGSIPGPAKRFMLLRKTADPAKKPEIRQGVVE